jgi:flagellar basal body-associated protein FliL
MKHVKERPPQASLILFRILLGIAAALALVLIAGTIYGFVKRGKTPAPPPAAAAGADENIFSSLGTLRIPTADSEPETVIISIAFPYNKNDRPFFEELASRTAWFKSTVFDYVSSFTAEEIAGMDAGAINQELLKRFNAGLRLGQIRELYITDFMVL